MVASVCRRRFPSFLLLIAVCGCGGTASNPQMQTQRESDVPADRSLVLEEYMKAEIPAINKSWSAREMSSAAKGLAALAEKNQANLPRYESERSGILFARIISPENLSYFRDRSIPLAQRLPENVDFLGALNSILKLYWKAFLRHDVSDSEIVEIMGIEFRTTVVSIELLNEFAPTLKKEDPKYVNRMAGVEKMRQGMTTMVAGSLQTFRETRNYHSAQLNRLLDYMEETFPSIIGELAPSPASEILSQIQSLASDPLLLEFHPGLQRLHQKVTAAAAKSEDRFHERVGLKPEDLQKKGVTFHRLQAGEPDKTGWCLARSTGGGFTVILPGRFNDISQSVKAEDGVTISSHTVGMTTLLSVKFTAMVMSRPDGKFKTNSLDDLAEGFKKDGNQVEKRSLQIAGYPGIEFTVKGQDSSAIFRVFKTRDSVYQLIVEFPPVLNDKALKDAKRFFESFKLSEKLED